MLDNKKLVVFLWDIEIFSVCLGIVLSFIFQYVLGFSVCMLCLMDRGLWILYAFLAYKAYLKNNFWLCCMRFLRYILIALAILHLLMIKGYFNFCISSDLLALQGGIWKIIAKLDFRNCANEPSLFGFLNFPILLLLAYLFWEFLDLARSILNKGD